MQTKELSDLAKVHSDAIFLHNLTKAEVVMLLAVIVARVNQAISGEVKVESVAPPAPVIATKPLGSVIANKGYPCVCVACAKHIYTVNKDVHENESVTDFISSYTPMPGYPVMTKQLKISNVENNITTNCPDCGAELSLYLAGRQLG